MLRFNILNAVLLPFPPHLLAGAGGGEPGTLECYLLTEVNEPAVGVGIDPFTAGSRGVRRLNRVIILPRGTPGKPSVIHRKKARAVKIVERDHDGVSMCDQHESRHEWQKA